MSNSHGHNGRGQCNNPPPRNAQHQPGGVRQSVAIVQFFDERSVNLNFTFKNPGSFVVKPDKYSVGNRGSGTQGPLHATIATPPRNEWVPSCQSGEEPRMLCMTMDAHPPGISNILENGPHA